MDRLPADIVADTLVRLPVESLMHCRCVSKSWLQLTHQLRFIQMHLARTTSSQQPNRSFIISNLSIADTTHSTPLFSLEYDDTQNDYTCSVVRFSESEPRFVGLRVMGSCNGLVCLVGYAGNRFGRIYVSNPFTRYCIELPDPVDYSDDTAVGFGFSPNKNQYKVVTIRNVQLKGQPTRAVVSVCTLGDSTWRALGVIGFNVNWKVCPNQVLVSGALHWLTRPPTNVVIGFHVANEGVGAIALPNVSFWDCPSLGELDGCLSLTGFVFQKNHAEVWVMREYGVKESWSRRYSIDFTGIGLRNRGLIRTICLEENNGQLLILYRLGTLVSYNVTTMSLRRISFAYLPIRFEVINHVPSLVSPLNI